MDWELITTPNPNEKALRVWVDRGDVLNKLGSYAAGVTTLKDFGMGSGPEAECGLWVYTIPAGPDNTGRLAFHFAKNKTEEEKYTPYFSEPDHHSKDFYWPNVMERWRAVPDPTRAIEGRDPNGSTTFEMKWNALFLLKPYLDGKTQIERLWYLAPTKFQLQKPVVMQPVSFGWDLPGDGMEPARMLIGSRIHKPTRVLGPTVLSQTTYEPTFPSGWTRHLHDTDQVQLDSGLWQMWEDYAIPPAGAAVIRDK